MKLKYDSLAEPVTAQMIKDSGVDTSKRMTVRSMYISGIVLYAFISIPAVIGVLTSTRQGIQPEMIGVFILFAVVVVAAVIGAAYGSRLEIERTVRLKRFAEANGAVLKQNIVSPQIEGMIFIEGHTKILEESLRFDEGVEVGNYKYVKGSGKNRTTYHYNFARIGLNRNLPHMVLDAKSNNFLGSNLPSTFNTEQKLVLEGDFGNYFNVYVPEGYEADALYVFTPDVMSVLVENGANYDMEIVGNEMFIFKSGKIRLDSQTELEGLIKIVDSISTELRDQSKRYTDERTSERYVATTPDGAMPLVAVEGRRLKRRSPIFAVVFVVFLTITIFIGPLLPESISDGVLAILWVVVVLMAIGFTVANFVRSR